MLPELLAWFTGKEVNRRKYPRKRKPYRATFSVDSGVTQKPVIGLDISGGGLCVLTQEPVSKEKFEVRATIESRVFRVRANPSGKIPSRTRESRSGVTACVSRGFPLTIGIP